MNFSLSAPRRETFLVSAIIAILVVIGMIVPLPFFTSYALGLLLIAYLILVAGVLIDRVRKLPIVHDDEDRATFLSHLSEVVELPSEISAKR